MSKQGLAVYVAYKDGWPIAVGTVKELCKKLGRTENSVWTAISHTRKGRLNPDYGIFKVEEDEDDDE